MASGYRYEFNKNDVYRFADLIGTKTKQMGNELSFMTCPYCKGQGRDNQYKFSINLISGAFKCLRSSCEAKGNMITLAKDFDFKLSGWNDAPVKKYMHFKKPEKPIVPKAPAVKYLESRGISEDVAKRYEITTQNGKDNILVFPFFDDKGEMPFIKYRKTDFDKAKDSNKEWTQKGGKPILFGMKQCNLENKTLIITEGQMDSLSVVESGLENGVSVPTGAKGFTWIPHCWEWMHNFDTLIVFGDHEKDHITLVDELKSRINFLRIKVVREEDYKDCKDANDILRKHGKEQVRACVENAKDIPIQNVIALADVKDINPFEIEKMKTGFKDLDELLYGGLPFGGITLITGKSGEGKSTVISQMLLYAIQEGHKVFAYSGELPNGIFKAWLTYQAAGANHVFKYRTQWGNEGYNVSDSNKQQIYEWFRDNIFVYSDENIEGDEKADLIKISEDMIVRCGVDVILIDNLMTGLDLVTIKESDKYERQSLFVKALGRLCLKYNVLIMLVAHMRKNNFSANGNDEVSGSGDITNLCSITLMYERDRDNPDNRKLKCWKNRMFGRTNPEGWNMYYDERSKRVYGDRDNVNYEFGWSDGFMESMDNPFT